MGTKSSAVARTVAVNVVGAIFVSERPRTADYEGHLTEVVSARRGRADRGLSAQLISTDRAQTATPEPIARPWALHPRATCPDVADRRQATVLAQPLATVDSARSGAHPDGIRLRKRGSARGSTMNRPGNPGGCCLARESQHRVSTEEV
jgi:hypothetical protein